MRIFNLSKNTIIKRPVRWTYLDVATLYRDLTSLYMRWINNEYSDLTRTRDKYTFTCENLVSDSFPFHKLSWTMKSEGLWDSLFHFTNSDLQCRLPIARYLMNQRNQSKSTRATPRIVPACVAREHMRECQPTAYTLHSHTIRYNYTDVNREFI